MIAVIAAVAVLALALLVLYVRVSRVDAELSTLQDHYNRTTVSGALTRRPREARSPFPGHPCDARLDPAEASATFGTA